MKSEVLMDLMESHLQNSGQNMKNDSLSVHTKLDKV